MPHKAIGSAEDAALRSARDPQPATQHATSRREEAIRQDDGVTNPRDGRGPLRPRDDQAVKLPLRPAH